MYPFFSFYRLLLLQYFQKDMPANFEADPEGVIHLAFSIKINQKKMKKLEKEYTTMKTKEKEDEIELRVSRFLILRFRGPPFNWT